MRDCNKWTFAYSHYWISSVNRRIASFILTPRIGVGADEAAQWSFTCGIPRTWVYAPCLWDSLEGFPHSLMWSTNCQCRHRTHKLARIISFTAIVNMKCYTTLLNSKCVLSFQILDESARKSEESIRETKLFRKIIGNARTIFIVL